MAAGRKSFEERYWDKLEEDDRRRDRAIEALSKKVSRLSDELSTHVASHNFKSEGPKWYDHKLAYIAAVCVLIFLLILAAALGVEVPKGITV